MNTKQVIVIRADLKLRRGKECAQVAHASSAWMREYMLYAQGSELTSEQECWLKANYRKIVVKATSEKQLHDLAYEAQNRGLTTHLIVDDGLTEVPLGTITALAIGPNEASMVDEVTGHLALY